MAGGCSASARRCGSCARRLRRRWGTGLSRLDLPLFGGTLVPAPDLLLLLVANSGGIANFAKTWPAGMPAGRDVFTQAWLLDASGPQGWTATNALQCTTL